MKARLIEADEVQLTKDGDRVTISPIPAVQDPES
jgi:hypothetical protein